MRRPGRRSVAAAAVVAALTLAPGAITATAQPTPPSAPSWDEVERAQGDVRATEAAIARIIDAVRDGEATAAAAAREALIAGEDYQLAVIALDETTGMLDALERRRDAADAVATASALRAAQLVTQLSRASGGDITTSLLISTDAEGLLWRLGSLSKLTQSSRSLLDQAIADRDFAASLAEQAEVARGERERLVADADAALTTAMDAAVIAEQRVAEQQAQVLELSERLAVLTGRSAELERAYLDAIRAEDPAPAPPAPPATPAPPSPSPTPSAPAPRPTVSPTPGAPSPSPTPTAPTPRPTSPSPTPPAPSPTPPAPSPSPPAPAPSPTPTPTPTPTPPPSSSVPAPNQAAVNTAIAFARQQLGKPYLFGGRGPDAWDCSGLTMMAYAAAGYSIGGHSATMQYAVAAQRGRTLPYSQALPGDLIFYSTGGSATASKYHVAMYLGQGQMIEAPSPGNPVRIVAVRHFERVPFVARPTP
ncbi:NlpC/P60 family protein [Microcella sp.]|uniref:C40 family peptidase n=1 Tax=Microcella sp. TaxID=1913979 RepID=UPI00391B97EF